MNPKRALLKQRNFIVEHLPPLTEVVRGSLLERRLRCGKPNCHCAEGEGHLAWYLTVSFAGGRTEQVTVPRRWVGQVRQWLDNYQRWWEGLEDVSAINRDLLRKRWLEEPAEPKRAKPSR